MISPREYREVPELKGMKRLGLDFLLYDFNEKVSLLPSNENVTRPEKPIRFKLNETNLEIWYKGLAPVIVCNCKESHLETTCRHKKILCEKFLVQMMNEIFSTDQDQNTPDSLRNEVAQKVSLIHPRKENKKENKILEKNFSEERKAA